MNILMTRQRGPRALSGLAALGWALPALAVNDLPGGPAVNQLDLHPPASKMAADIIVLHNGMLIVCLVIFLAVFGVMFLSASMPSTASQSAFSTTVWR
jgi:cytochrome c oxidase subunit 2